MGKARFLSAALLCVCAMVFVAQANFYPERVYKERSKLQLNKGWSFYSEMRGNNPAPGSPWLVNYTDNTWAKINIPHSATYDAPTKTEEDKTIAGGICWYRKTFAVPAGFKHTDKLFLQFDGAMQSATVWLNGNQLGVHDNSGYTGFKFDITGKTVAGNNVLVVKLDNTYNTAIPPGNPGNDGGPDYYIFSGLYRNVWLVGVDKCYIPLDGQQISVRTQAPYQTTTSKAYIRIKTPVRNEYATAKTVTVQYAVAYGDVDSGFLYDSSMVSVPAGQTATLDKTVSFDNPKLWSLTTPYLYRLFTRVFADGVLIDDNVDRFGVRWFTWNPNERFKLNDQEVYIRGSSLHQMFPWIQNAATSSRFLKDIKLAKDMGVNLVRCAHYPRDPSFYNACDEIGMLCLVEIPTWGVGKPSYVDAFWTRQTGNMSEMIEVGYNHPSIVAWGLFNEPGGDFISNITALNNQAHSLDSTRMTYMANNSMQFNIMKIPDICGLNYKTAQDIAVTPVPGRLINTEFHKGWELSWSFRGDANDIITGIANEVWVDWQAVIADPVEAGGTLWCHADYNSPVTKNPMGAVDAYRIPKSIYYLFRKNWTGVAYDNDVPVAGTATTLKIEADTNTIVADSSDCAFVYVSVRDASGKCIHTGYGTTSTTTVNFTITGPGNGFGTTKSGTTYVSAVKADGGKCALMVKSTNTPGTITISAAATGLTGASTTITSVADTYNESDYPFIAPVLLKSIAYVSRSISFKKTGNFLHIGFPSKEVVPQKVAILNMKGQSVACPVIKQGRELVVDTKVLAGGSYCISLKKASSGESVIKQFIVSK